MAYCNQGDKLALNRIDNMGQKKRADCKQVNYSVNNGARHSGRAYR